MHTLKDLKIESLSSDSKAIDPERIPTLLDKIPGWKLEISSDGQLVYLIREYRINSYERVLALHAKIGEFAESVQHHPEMISQYSSLTVKWWSHSVGGLHLNDFICAAHCDEFVCN